MLIFFGEGEEFNGFIRKLCLNIYLLAGMMTSTKFESWCHFLFIQQCLLWPLKLGLRK